MQEEKYKDFDLELRSVLDDAQEEVSPRVWEAVSSRLGHSGAPVSRWGFAALAFAAAAALAVLLMLPVNTRETVPASMLSDNVECLEPFMKEATGAVGEMDAVRTVNASGRRPVFAEASVPAQATTTEDIEDDTVQVRQDDQSTGTAETGADEVVEVYSGPSNTAGIEKSFAVFESAGEKDAGHRKIAFDVRGAMSSNDKSLKNMFNGAWATSGEAVSYGSRISESSESKYFAPLSVGVGVRFYVTDRFAVGTGLQYSYLSRNFQGTYQGQKDLNIDHMMHYVGIPVTLSFDIYRSRLMDFYAYAGGTGEYAVSNKYRIHGAEGIINYSEAVKGLQWSATAGLGIQFNVNDLIGIYMDPSARYYFNCSQPKNVRTQKPLMFNFEIGLRFNIQ